MREPPCFEICPLAQDLFRLAEASGQTQDSAKAFAAYSKIFCLEVDLKRGVCVKNWHQIAKDAGEEAVSHLRAYTHVKRFTMSRQDIEKFFVNHHDIMPPLSANLILN